MDTKKKKRKAKHRHKWESVIYDCGLCGGGEVEECSCGEIRQL